jgi:hypothetical protein
MKRASKMIIGIIVVALVIGLTAVLVQQYSFHPVSLPNQPEIVFGLVTIDAGVGKSYEFAIPEGVRTPEIYGNFAVSNDSTGSIRVCVMDAPNYVNWQNNRTLSSYYDSGQVTSATIEQALAAGKTYYLIFDNTLSTSPKNITTDMGISNQRFSGLFLNRDYISSSYFGSFLIYFANNANG